MTLRVHNTLTKRLEPFTPREPGVVRMYNCGPTVYGRPHIGNLRSFLFADLLRRWLARHKPEMLWVADRVDRSNAHMGDQHAAVGPSHFMKHNLDDEWVRLIWEHSILPYVGEHFFGEEDRLREFELDALAGTDPSPVIDTDAPSDAD